MSSPILSSSSQSSPSTTLKAITDLQGLEQKLYEDLEKLAVSPQNTNDNSKDVIVGRINELSNARVSLFNSLNDLYTTSQDEVSNSRKELMDKIVVSKIMENQLNNMKSIINEVNGIRDNKLRMVEINTYYGKRYQAHTDLMKLIIKVCVVLFILIIINKKQLLPSPIVNTLMILVVGLGLFFIIRQIWDLSQRDNMDYDKYIHPIMDKQEIQNMQSNQGQNKIFSGFDSLDTWSICGEGTQFDYDKNQCIVSPVEQFKVIGYNKPSVYSSGPKSYNNDYDEELM
jgi:hypothetical protein